MGDGGGGRWGRVGRGGVGGRGERWVVSGREKGGELAGGILVIKSIRVLELDLVHKLFK